VDGNIWVDRLVAGKRVSELAGGFNLDFCIYDGLIQLVEMLDWSVNYFLVVFLDGLRLGHFLFTLRPFLLFSAIVSP
jgi:hypothetical protein